MFAPLRLGTATTFRAGPFLDSTDGNSHEAGLTLAQSDIQISKAGGAFASTSDASPTTTYDSVGHYQLPLTATDTNTLGNMRVYVNVSGALPVWHDFTVIPAVVYDSLVAGSDNLQVDALQIEGSDATNQLTAACTASLTTYDAPTRAEATADKDEVLAAVATVDTEVGEIRGATFDTATDSLEAIRNRGDSAWTTGAGGSAPTVEEIRAEIDSNSTQLAAALAAIAVVDGVVDQILVDTGTDTPATLAVLDDLIDSIKAVTDQFVFTSAGKVDATTLRIGTTDLTQGGTGGQGYGA